MNDPSQRKPSNLHESDNPMARALAKATGLAPRSAHYDSGMVGLGRVHDDYRERRAAILADGRISTAEQRRLVRDLHAETSGKLAEIRNSTVGAIEGDVSRALRKATAGPYLGNAEVYLAELLRADQTDSADGLRNLLARAQQAGSAAATRAIGVVALERGGGGFGLGDQTYASIVSDIAAGDTGWAEAVAGYREQEALRPTYADQLRLEGVAVLRDDVPTG